MSGRDLEGLTAAEGKIVPSRSTPGKISLRAADGTSIRDALDEAGFEAGEVVIVIPAARYDDLIAIEDEAIQRRR